MSQCSLYGTSCSYWTRCCTDVTTDRYIASHRERADSILTIEYNNKVCNISPNLKSPANTSGSDTRRCRPITIWKAGNNETRSRFLGENKSGFENLEDSKSYKTNMKSNECKRINDS